METQPDFSEELFHQMYLRRGYQVYRLCLDAASDRQTAVDLMTRAFDAARQQLGTRPVQELTVDEQDNTLLQCTRQVLQQASPQAAPAAPAPAQPAAAVQAAPVQPAAPVQVVPPVQAAAPLPLYSAVQAEACGAPAGTLQPDAEDNTFRMPGRTTGGKELNGFGTGTAPAPANDQFSGFVPQESHRPAKKAHRGLMALLIVLLVILILVLLWAIWGFAQVIFGLPYLDLGYQWFNNNVFPIF